MMNTLIIDDNIDFCKINLKFLFYLGFDLIDLVKKKQKKMLLILTDMDHSLPFKVNTIKFLLY